MQGERGTPGKGADRDQHGALTRETLFGDWRRGSLRKPIIETISAAFELRHKQV